MNTRLIWPLAVDHPRRLRLRVGNETRAWREGEVVLFDDSVEHEAWNQSKELRVVMIFDIWRRNYRRERTLLWGDAGCPRPIRSNGYNGLRP